MMAFDPLDWRFHTGPWVERECKRLRDYRLPNPLPEPPAVMPNFGRGLCLGDSFPLGSVLWFTPGQPVDGDVVLVDVGPVFRHVATAQVREGSQEWSESAQATFIAMQYDRWSRRPGDTGHRLGKLYRVIDGEAWLICFEGAFLARPHNITGVLRYAAVNGRSAFGGGPLPPDRN